LVRDRLVIVGDANLGSTREDDYAIGQFLLLRRRR
jgi:hypothetical protein